MVSWLVLTAAPDEALLFPVLASELFAALREELSAIEAAIVVLLLGELVLFNELLLLDELLPLDELLLEEELPVLDEVLIVLEVLTLVAAEAGVVAGVTVPTTAFVVCVPEAVPPEVLT
jgi:hypothetical protein